MKTLFTHFLLLSLASAYGQAVPKPEPSKVSDIRIEVVPIDRISEPAQSDEPYDNSVHSYADVQVKPEYAGEAKAFAAYFKNNINTATVKGVKAGTYTVQIYFVVEKDGSLTDIKGVTSPQESMTDEVVRVARSIRKKWQPGIQNGKAVRTGYTLSVEVIIP